MLIEPLFQHANQQPNEVAVVDDHGTYTFAQLATMAAGLGAYVRAQTQQPRVGILLPAGAGFVASFYGILLAGKGAVPINFLLGDREVAHVIADSGIDTVITIPLLAGKLKDARLNVIDLMALPKPPVGAIGLSVDKLPQAGADDLAVLLYTSGTSGLPKGVMLTYGNLQSDVEACINHAEFREGHRFLGILPLFHSTGLLGTMIAPVTLGSIVVYIGRFSPVGTLKAIKEHKLSVLIAVPSMYGALLRLKDAGPDDMKHVYATISGGEPLSSAVREGYQAKFGVPIYEGYGLTETIGPITFNHPGAAKAGSVGTLVDGAKVRIADDDGNPLPVGQSGEVWFKGPMIMKGYFNLPNETADALTGDGYFKTGDLGKLDDDGYLYITGRKKDLIIVAGEKASPREIEEVLIRHPAVQEAAVVGKKDPSRGEVVVAFVIAKEGQKVVTNDIRDFCGKQGLVPWKCPREVRVVSDLPRSPTGKVLKRVLQEQLLDSVDAPGD